MNKNKKFVLIAVPLEVLKEIDSVAKELKVSRTRFMLESALRNLRFAKRSEIPHLKQIEELANR